MDFELDPEAAALVGAVIPVLDAEATTALIRGAWPASSGAAAGGVEQVRKVWATLADIGLAGALVPDGADGLGLTISDVVPLLERVGHAGLPVPAVETVAFAAPLLAAAGHPALPDLVAGRALVAVATRTPSGDIVVPHGQQADLIILPVPAPPGATSSGSARSSGSSASASASASASNVSTGSLASDAFGGLPHGTARLRIYRADELELAPVGTVDGARALARLTASPDPLAGAVLTDDPDAARLAWWRAAVGTSAVLVGLAARMLTITVDYVKTRHQFGVPVGSFQAVKHACASAHLATEFARPAVLAAGWQLAHSPDDHTAARDATLAARDATLAARDAISVAKVLAAESARLAARVAIQCHGAIAYTTEYDLHLFAKRAWALIPAFGDPVFHRAQLAKSLGLRSAAPDAAPTDLVPPFGRETSR
ncbi:acyl-CoA dehydrogenase family protein [Pseudofrankia inefficax]|uniref:Acyl-CoA dehydrogenase domain-containing protein n=1 Tax=Pseudofrankia inefficax (strain DSM 45817 / CECT 9037 / DDB 130130 / EuI1c) TaxID=298654 RepID=E3J2G2_PSEI1|nr:acyl-CoA dehydrogenase family protein [Pseudofrankia inefficax]ADP79334.1 acyl-CoA dehydrogenase domain-containing protein [Pseudofrankia inefficax]